MVSSRKGAPIDVTDNIQIHAYIHVYIRTQVRTYTNVNGSIMTKGVLHYIYTVLRTNLASHTYNLFLCSCVHTYPHIHTSNTNKCTFMHTNM